MGNDKISFEDLCNPEFRRKELMKEKAGAVWTVFLELDEMVGVGKFSEKVFGQSEEWFRNKLNGFDWRGPEMCFNAEEYDKIAEGLRELGERLVNYSEEIKKAELEQ